MPLASISLRLAVAVEKSDAHRGRPLDVGVIFRDRQAALLVERALVGGGDDLRIDQEERVRLGLLVLALGDVDDREPPGDADLDGGEADAGRVVHGLQHVVHETAEIVVDALYRRAFQAQLAVGKGDDVELGHGVSDMKPGAPGQPAPESSPAKRGRGTA